MALRHAPERSCVGCRNQHAKRAMVRIVRTAAGNVVVDLSGKLSGRGAYLCREAACWSAGLRKETLGRALKATVSAEDRAALESFAATLTPVSQPETPRAATEGERT